MPEFSQSKSLFLYRDRENFLRTISAGISHSSARAREWHPDSQSRRQRRHAAVRSDNGSANDKWPDANLERAPSASVAPFWDGRAKTQSQHAFSNDPVRVSRRLLSFDSTLGLLLTSNSCNVHLRRGSVSFRLDYSRSSVRRWSLVGTVSLLAVLPRATPHP